MSHDNAEFQKRTRDWLERLYGYLLDAEGERQRQLGSELGFVGSGSHEKTSRPKALRLELAGRILPIANEEIRPTLERAKNGLDRILKVVSHYRHGQVLSDGNEVADLVDVIVEKMLPICREIDDDLRALEQEASPREDATPATPRPPNEFHRRADGRWSVDFAGAGPVVIDDMLGMGYLHALLCRPNDPIHVCELRAMDAPTSDAVGLETQSQREKEGLEGDGLGFDGDQSDATARDNYKKRLRDLVPKIEDAKARGDDAARARLEDEGDQISACLTGANSRDEPTDRKRARQAVGIAISRAIDVIAKPMPILADHLREYVDLGAQCVYQPPQEVPWNGPATPSAKSKSLLKSNT